MTSKIRIVAMFVNLDWQPIILTSCTRVFAVNHRDKFQLPNSNVSLVITIQPYVKRKCSQGRSEDTHIYEVSHRSAHAQNRDAKAHTCRKAERSSRKMFVKIFRTTGKSKLLDKIFAKLFNLESQENPFIWSRVVIFRTDGQSNLTGVPGE